MDAGDLRIFVEVAEAGSFREAARRLYVSQPTVTRAVRRLEADLGVPVLSRGPVGAALTAQGRILLRGARGILASVDRVRSEIKGQRKSRVRLGAAATVVATVLAPFLGAWLEEHPDISVEVVHSGSGHLLPHLENRACDVVILTDAPPPAYSFALLRMAHVCAVLPAAHRLALMRGPLDLRALDGEPVLVKGAPYKSTMMFHDAALRNAFEPNVAYQCASGQTLATLVEARLGTAILGDIQDLRGFDLPRRVLMDDAGHTLSFGLYAAWRTGPDLTPETSAFTQDLVAFTKRRAKTSANTTHVS